MIENQTRARWILALVLSLILVVLFWASSGSLHRQLNNTGAQLARTWMLDSVNRYRHIWLIAGEPDYIDSDGLRLKMTASGLVMPLDHNQQFDCDTWLAVHFPQRKVMAANLLKVDRVVESGSYVCRYHYSNGELMVLSFNQNYLKINVEKSTR